MAIPETGVAYGIHVYGAEFTTKDLAAILKDAGIRVINPGREDEPANRIYVDSTMVFAAVAAFHAAGYTTDEDE